MGEFQKLLVLDNHAFALVKPFNICSADFMLCEDNVTDAQLNEHMVPLSLPSGLFKNTSTCSVHEFY